MTEPSPWDRRQPRPRCTYPGCGHPAATTSLYAGRRCRCHHERFDADVAARLAAAGWGDTADAYRKTYGETA